MSNKYYEIDETAARRAKEANSFRDYKPGSATAGYRAAVDRAVQIAERQKARVDPIHHERIDKLLDTYARKLAANMNKSNEIDARVPSVMIAGPAKFPTQKKEKQNAARDRNMEEWQHIQGLLDKIQSTGRGGISADDPAAVDKLREKLEGLEADQKHMKSANAHWRKHKTMKDYPGLSNADAAAIDLKMQTAYSWVQRNGPYEAWKLQNNNANMRRIRDRITELERQAEKPPAGWAFEGGEVVMNTEENRLQVLFDEKPDDAMRQELKSRGFRWAPSQGAWQRQLTDNALYAAKQIQAIQPSEPAPEKSIKGAIAAYNQQIAEKPPTPPGRSQPTHEDR